MVSRCTEGPAECSSLVEVLRQRTAKDPAAALFAFHPDGEPGCPQRLTRRGLDEEARRIAARLQRTELAGQRALLLYPPGLDFIAAFFGCLYAGVVAVPANVPRGKRPSPRLSSIIIDARPSVILTCGSQREDGERWAISIPELQNISRLMTGEGGDVLPSPEDWTETGLSRETLAFLQYTSGSTAAPKGVMITHGNLLANSARIMSHFGAASESRGVFWLPLFHDMGLIGGMIQTVYSGGVSTFLSPVHFLQRPLRWLRAITSDRATISGGPNFAYDLCVDRTTPAERTELDLSCWQVAFNGAEMIRPETMERFARAFAPAGFRREAFLPCYGLAEATLLVSSDTSSREPVTASLDRRALEHGNAVELSEPADQVRLLAASGNVVADHRVVIVDPATCTPCPGDRVGEIWVQGPSIAQGYWGRSGETEEVFRATLAGDGAAPFLRTGDLGFLKDGLLYVTGRIKELIIIRGRNIYPQDIERAVEMCHPLLRGDGGAAFSIDEADEERLVVVHEIERHAGEAVVNEVIMAVRQAIAEQFEVEVHAIRFIKPLKLPRTSSGKVRRRLCRAVPGRHTRSPCWLDSHSFGKPPASTRDSGRDRAISRAKRDRRHFGQGD